MRESCKNEKDVFEKSQLKASAAKVLCTHDDGNKIKMVFKLDMLKKFEN